MYIYIYTHTRICSRWIKSSNVHVEKMTPLPGHLDPVLCQGILIIYIYIYREREIRERERDVYIYIYMYVYAS